MTNPLPSIDGRTIRLALWILLLPGALVAIGGGIYKHAHSHEAEYQKFVKPVLSQNCYGCHNEEKHKGGLSLAAFPDLEAVRGHHDIWKKVLPKLRSGEMPPEDKPQPTAAQRERLVTWIEAEVFPIDPRHPDPGRVTLRRLNR